jgi:hypothetical protein
MMMNGLRGIRRGGGRVEVESGPFLLGREGVLERLVLLLRLLLRLLELRLRLRCRRRRLMLLLVLLVWVLRTLLLKELWWWWWLLVVLVEDVLVARIGWMLELLALLRGKLHLLMKLGRRRLVANVAVGTSGK